MLDKALMHLMACNVCVKHLQNDVVGRETHAHDLKGINGGNPTLRYGSVSCVSNIPINHPPKITWPIRSNQTKPIQPKVR